MQQVSYDTTFCLGDFYLSVLLFRHTDFQPSPIVPLAFFLHERKLQCTHESFFKYIKSVIPVLDEATNVYMVTDGERAINAAITVYFPNLKTFRCWNHTVQVTVLLHFTQEARLSQIPRDPSCLSVVSFNIPTDYSVVFHYYLLRLQIY